MAHKIILLLSVVLLFQFQARAQAGFSANIGLGATGVDVEALVEEDENPGSWADDWDQFSYIVSMRYVHPVREDLDLGFELGYHRLFWYSVSVPYPPTRIYREYEVGAVKLTALVQYHRNNWRFDGGVEANFLDGVAPGIHAAVMHELGWLERPLFAVGVRTDLIAGTVAYPFIGMAFEAKFNR